MLSLWVGIAALAQLINAGTVIMDKYVLACLKCGVKTPVAYAFWISLLSGFVIVMVPFGVIDIPSSYVLILSSIAAVSFIFSLISLYSALHESIASDVIPAVGAISAITTVLLAAKWLHTDLPQFAYVAFTFLVLGTLLISHFRFTYRSFILVLFAGVLFGFTAYVTKLIFLETDFVDGFFWSRMTNVAGALLLLLWPSNRKAIFSGAKDSSSGVKWLVLTNKTLAGIASVLTLFAISIGSVSIVNAMAGLQFVFVIVIAYVFAKVFPRVFEGEVRQQNYRHKLYGVALIVLGIAALFAGDILLT